MIPRRYPGDIYNVISYNHFIYNIYNHFGILSVKYCKELTVVTDSVVSYERQPAGSVIKIKCAAGFKNNGEEGITCRANGTWSSFPDCNKYNG